MTMPLVSVVIASFNQAKYLGNSVESVLNQTYGNVELIVVDDGSTDNTQDVLSQYCDRITVIQQPNSERGAARNRGLSEAHGEFIAFLDADDSWTPKKLTQEVEYFLKHPDTGVLYSDVKIIDESGQVTGCARKPSHFGWVTQDILTANFISFSAHLLRREAAVKVGGFPESRLISGSEDWIFWVHLSTQVQFAHLPVVTAFYRVHPENTSSNAAAMERSMSRAAEEIEHSRWLPAEMRTAIPAMHANISLANAINFCSCGNRRTAWHYLLAAARYNPRIILDPRFPYTVFRNSFPRVTSRLRLLWHGREVSARHYEWAPGSNNDHR